MRSATPSAVNVLPTKRETIAKGFLYNVTASTIQPRNFNFPNTLVTEVKEVPFIKMQKQSTFNHSSISINYTCESGIGLFRVKLRF